MIGKYFVAVVTVMPSVGDGFTIRKGTTPESIHREIEAALKIPTQV
jgi:hypothetical protein